MWMYYSNIPGLYHEFETSNPSAVLGNMLGVLDYRIFKHKQDYTNLPKSEYNVCAFCSAFRPASEMQLVSDTWVCVGECNKYDKARIAEDLELAGRPDAAYWLMLETGDVSLHNHEEVLAFLRKFTSPIWGDAIRDLEYWYKDTEDPYLDNDHLMILGSRGDSDSGVYYYWYPRYVNGANGEQHENLLNTRMWRSTEYQCGHEWDCCGCRQYGCMNVIYYDDISGGWILSQNYHRNI